MVEKSLDGEHGHRQETGKLRVPTGLRYCVFQKTISRVFAVIRMVWHPWLEENPNVLKRFSMDDFRVSIENVVISPGLQPPRDINYTGDSQATFATPKKDAT